jgi:gamma-glutamyltranspeptidase/glutathione hydrolase
VLALETLSGGPEGPAWGARMAKARRFLLILVLLPSLAWAAVATERAPHAMVASAHALASRAGVAVMQQGGNGFDAAVAVGFALAVVHPQAGNLGGGGFLLARDAAGKEFFLDFRETAPAAASRNMYVDRQGKLVAGASTIGFRSVAVPGTVAGLVYAQKHWGKLPLAHDIAPAIELARDGFVLSASDAEDFRDPELAKFPQSRRIFQRNGNYYRPGEIFRQPELAHTLERIAGHPDDFYRGKMAQQIAAFVQKSGGILTTADLAAYGPKLRQPVHGTYRGYDIIGAPPPSSGGVTLIEALNILEGFRLSLLPPDSAEAITLVAEAFRRAFFDRAELLGDPDFSKIPVAQLLDKHYAAAWRESIDPLHASPSSGLRRPASVLDKLDRVAAVTVPEPDHTTHYSVVDSDGTAVAVTTTLNDSFGSRVTVAGLGFLLNDEMDDFASRPGAPNMYGLIQGEANAIAPGRRPLSAMAPTIVLKDGKVFLVLGSRGGPKIITAVANVIVGVIDYGLSLQQAVDAPRFHHQWEPDILRLEGAGFSAQTVKRLAGMGYRVQRGYAGAAGHRDTWGDVECIEVDPATGERVGASDPRGQGKPAGF